MTEKKTETPILTKIQNELKAPKNQYNSFGKYSYRSAEDIEQALKPLLLKYGATLYITEDIKAIGERKYIHHTSGRNAESVNAEGNRYYIVETVHYKDPEQTVTIQGMAREGEEKKGMDPAQLTGATSSYAVKYALGKLFLIDDTQDADSQKPARTAGRTARRQAPARQRPTAEQKEAARRKAIIARAKTLEVQYGGGKMRLVEVIRMEAEGDSQAKLFLGDWRQKSPKNEAAYKFIVENKLAA